jgi:hypothetical protein
MKIKDIVVGLSAILLGFGSAYASLETNTVPAFVNVKLSPNQMQFDCEMVGFCDTGGEYPCSVTLYRAPLGFPQSVQATRADCETLMTSSLHSIGDFEVVVWTYTNPPLN